MLKKAAKTLVFLVVLLASGFSFIYINSAAPKIGVVTVDIEQTENLPDDHSVVLPAISVVKKAIALTKGFLYPVN